MSDQTKQQEARSLPATFAKNEFEKDVFILRQLVTKDFKIKYRRSVLGVAWSVLNPLLMMIVMAIVFSTIFAQGRNGSITPEMYPLYLIVGNVTFAVMSESTNQALTSIVGAAPLLKKVKVHRWVFPVQKVLFSLVNFAFLASDSAARLPAVAYVFLHGPGHDALCPHGLFPRRYASVECCHHGVDLHHAHLLDDRLYCADATYRAYFGVREPYVQLPAVYARYLLVPDHALAYYVWYVRRLGGPCARHRLHRVS